MLSTILRYEVETIKNVEGKMIWKIRDTITPNYGYKEFPVMKRFLFWTWTKSSKAIINEKRARIYARNKAFKKAKRLYPEYATRVFVVFKFPEIEEPIRHCVWENGHYYSTH